uniref:Uncharacterized protein n=1 Tax=Glossina pallidipes TaxID=7398 RepID=A0A1A9Z5P5_GLOPL
MVDDDRLSCLNRSVPILCFKPLVICAARTTYFFSTLISLKRKSVFLSPWLRPWQQFSSNLDSEKIKRNIISLDLCFSTAAAAVVTVAFVALLTKQRFLSIANVPSSISSEVSQLHGCHILSVTTANPAPNKRRSFNVKQTKF